MATTADTTALKRDDDESDPPVDARGARAKKSPNAFRTISEVAEDLHIAQHVLRFWETKFTQVRPLKRGGGRRYYRPDDIVLLKRIADLLYFQGYTIKGVQRLLREGGGRLSDDIGPPTADDRDEPADTEPPACEPELALPGLATLTADPPRARSRRPAEGQGEAAVLRQVLRDMLTELEALRALLP